MRILGKKKLSWEEMKLGAKLLVGSFAVEAVLLAPEQEVEILGEKVKIKGIVSMKKDQLAEVVRRVLNYGVPAGARVLDNLLRKSGFEPWLRNLSVYFVYDFLDKYSLSTLLTKIFRDTDFLEKNKFSSTVKSYLEGILNNEGNREEFIKKFSKSVIDALEKIAEGTMLSLLFTDHLRETFEEAVGSGVEKLLETGIGAQIVDKLTGGVQYVENLTLGNFLTNHFGLDKDTMGMFLDDLYNKYLGEEHIAKLESSMLGDQVYATMINTDYNEFFEDLKRNHVMDLIRVGLSAAGAGLYIVNASKEAEGKVRMIRAKKELKKARKLEQKNRRKSS